MHLCTTAYVTEYSQNQLAGKHSGEVLLAHSSGVYLRFGEEIFLLCDKSWGALPIGITVEHFSETCQALGPEAGQAVFLEENRLIFPGGCITLCPLQTPAEAPCLSKPQATAILQAAEALAGLQKRSGLSMLVLPLLLGRPCDPELLQNPYFSLAHSRFTKLIAAIGHHDAGQTAAAVQQLLGLGVGLTPSADDVFLGMLYIFRKLPQRACAAVFRFQETVFREAPVRTNPISAAYLKAILQGAPFARMERVYRGLCAEEPLNITHLTQIGSNSGSEMLLGMLIALYIYRYHISNEEESQ